MSHQKHQTGQTGEQLAIQSLKNKGMRLLEQNWRSGRAEIDLIFRMEDLLVFVEVKTRRSNYLGSPGSFLSNAQEQRIGQAASHYCEQNNHLWEIRFDLVEVVLQEDQDPIINHFPDAFYPGDEGW